LQFSPEFSETTHDFSDARTKVEYLTLISDGNFKNSNTKFVLDTNVNSHYVADTKQRLTEVNSVIGTLKNKIGDLTAELTSSCQF
jgi:hypothetical protein